MVTIESANGGNARMPTAPIPLRADVASSRGIIEREASCPIGVRPHVRGMVGLERIDLVELEHLLLVHGEVHRAYAGQGAANPRVAERRRPIDRHHVLPG